MVKVFDVRVGNSVMGLEHGSKLQYHMAICALTVTHVCMTMKYRYLYELK